MDAIKEYLRIADKLEHEEITPLEYDELCEPLRNVVEVVRCKDCVHGIKDFDKFLCEWYQAFHNGDWFCADGERKLTMTNREYLETLSDNELAKYIIHELQSIWMRYNNSELGLSSWLAKERGEDE